MKKNQLALSGFLAERRQSMTVAPTNVNQRSISPEEIDKANALVAAFALRAQKCVNSRLIRLPAAHTRLAIGRSTFLKKVRLKELPQPVYCGPRVTAYREIDLDMTIAAQTLASHYGLMLDMKKFVAALSAPIVSVMEVIA